MQPSNPAVFECKAVKSTIHTWLRRDDRSAYCLKCNVELTKQQADEVWHDYNIKTVYCTEPAIKWEHSRGDNKSRH